MCQDTAVAMGNGRNQTTAIVLVNQYKISNHRHTEYTMTYSSITNFRLFKAINCINIGISTNEATLHSSYHLKMIAIVLIYKLT